MLARRVLSALQRGAVRAEATAVKPSEEILALRKKETGPWGQLSLDEKVKRKLISFFVMGNACKGGY
jgi:hypothetical protein